MTNALFRRAEDVRRETSALVREFQALRDLRALERDFRRLTKDLAQTMNSQVPFTGAMVKELLAEAEEFLLS